MFLIKSSVIVLCLSLAIASSQAPAASEKIFDQQGLTFQYAVNWELGGDPTGEVQQLVLTEKTLDAQIMIISPRMTITSKEAEAKAKHDIIEPAINRLIKQYDDVGIRIEQAPLSGEVAGIKAEGLQLRFFLDGQPGLTDIYWLLINQRLVQLVFVRPARTATQSTACWDLIRRTIKIHKA